MDIRFGSFNLKNLVLPGVVFYEDEKYSESTYARKIQWISGQLDAMRAQAVGFQEVFHREALVQAVSGSCELQEAEVIAWNEKSTSNPGEPACMVGLATTLPVDQCEAPIRRFPEGFLDTLGFVPLRDTFRRPVLRARLAVGSSHVIVYVAHLKSKGAMIQKGEDKNDPGIKALGYARSLLMRGTEAAALRWLLIEETRNKNLPVIVMGDFNDAADSVTTTIMLGDAPWWGDSDAEKQAKNDVLFHSTYELQAGRRLRDVYYTHIWEQEYETLDHILISDNLVGYDKAGYLRYIDIYNDHLARIRDWNSDHGQVVASMRFNL